MTIPSDFIREIRHFHMACGLGGGAKGFNMASPRAGGLVGKMRCIGGVDIDPAAIRDFERASGTKGTVLDLFSRELYTAFHGHEPPPDWREATPADLQRAAGNERPHIVFASYPCKGNSGLLSETLSKTGKYQALNSLALRGTWLTLEAWADDPPELIVFENVPRIVQRSRTLLDQIGALLRSYGYAVRETSHDCGELGGLAQSRKRFLLVARHMEKVAPFLYEPDKQRLRAVGDVLGRMPLPGDSAGGPMHRIPRLQWRTWLRLAMVKAGSDWRSLQKLAVVDGVLRDYLIVPEDARPTTTGHSVADPRFEQSAKWTDGQAYGVRAWSDSTGAIAGQQNPGQGAYCVADPRHTGPAKHSNEFRIVQWDRACGAVTSAHGSGNAVADPRVLDRQPGDAYLSGGHYGVLAWSQHAGAVSAAGGHDNGRWSVADPRCSALGASGALPAATAKVVVMIRALDGTFHRPFTTLELAALQSLVEPEEQLELDGLSDQAWRERIGNAVPPKAAQAIGEVMGTTLLLAWSGETFMLSASPIWVRPVAVALAVHQGIDTDLYNRTARFDASRM